MLRCVLRKEPTVGSIGPSRQDLTDLLGTVVETYRGLVPYLGVAQCRVLEPLPARCQQGAKWVPKGPTGAKNLRTSKKEKPAFSGATFSFSLFL